MTGMGEAIMSKAITKENMALLKEASEMFNETGCVPGIDIEQVPAEKIVPDVKQYISETVDDPDAIYDPEIWDTPGFSSRGPDRQLVSTGVLRRKASSSICLTRKSATSARPLDGAAEREQTGPDRWRQTTAPAWRRLVESAGRAAPRALAGPLVSH
jgi:hypothetical protein